MRGSINHGRWISPSDLRFNSIKLEDISSDNHDQEGENTGGHFTSWEQLFINGEQIAKCIECRMFENRIQNKYLIAIENAKFPKRVSLCPSPDEVKKMLAAETLIISVFSTDCYDFSSEYLRIYQGKFDKLFAYEDSLSVVMRCLKVIEPTLSEEVCNNYADYVLRMTAWESSLCGACCDECMLPVLEKPMSTYRRSALVSHMRVYIGKAPSGYLRFIVRTVLQFEPKARPKRGFTEEDFISMLYYRELLLDDAAVREFKQLTASNIIIAGDQSKVQFIPPPPPRPKTSSVSDISIYIIAQYSSFQMNEFVATMTDKIRWRANLPSPQPAAGDDNSDEDDNSRVAEEERRQAAHLQKQLDEVEQNSALQRWLQSPPYNHADASFSAEVMAWGIDVNHSLGLGSTLAPSSSVNDMIDINNGGKDESQSPNSKMELNHHVYNPRTVPMDRMVTVERVLMIACSARHTMVLTQFGSLYSCGENTEGALGHGDFISR
jgi:hypothetical protein